MASGCAERRKQALKNAGDVTWPRIRAGAGHAPRIQASERETTWSPCGGRDSDPAACESFWRYYATALRYSERAARCAGS